MPYASIMILVGGIANTNNVSIHLQTSTVALLLVVATIYFQNSSFVVATSWAAYLVHIQITSTSGYFQRNELNYTLCSGMLRSSLHWTGYYLICFVADNHAQIGHFRYCRG